MLKQPSSKAFTQYNHYNVSRPFELIQMDTLFLPTDKKYRYCLCAIDAASRYKWAQPLTDKSSEGVVRAFKQMKLPLDKITTINTDSGTEFAGAFKKHLLQLGIELRVNLPSHHLSFVESFNGVLAKRLFTPMQVHEMDYGVVNKDWVSRLQSSVDELNNSDTQLIGMKPKDAVKLSSVPQPKNDFSDKDTKKEYPIGTIVRRMFNSDEVYDFASGTVKVEKRRRTDPWFTRQLYYVYDVIGDENGLKYHLIIAIEKPSERDNIYDHAYTYYQLSPVYE